MMSTKINSLLLVTLTLLFMGCSQAQKQSAEEILKDPEMQDSIMVAISNDHPMMMNMMEHMRQSKHAMQMIGSNKQMMQHMMQKNQMRGMMKDNPEIMDTMLTRMMNIAAEDTVICRRMSQMMMKDEHMQNMMQDIMGRKDMMMEEGRPYRMHMQMHRDNGMR